MGHLNDDKSQSKSSFGVNVITGDLNDSLGDLSENLGDLSPSSSDLTQTLGDLIVFRRFDPNKSDDLSEFIQDIVKLLIEGTKLLLQERESKLYNEFDRFTSENEETIHAYYLRFAQLINDMNTIGMTIKKLQVNTKFVNNLQPKWSKFVTDVKLAKDMHESSFNQLYAYLKQHEHNNCLTISTNQQLTQDLFQYKEPSYYSRRQGQSVECTRETDSELCRGNGHMARHCTQIKRPKNSEWFKEKMLLAQAQESGTDDLDAFDSDYDEAPSANAVLMAKLFAYDSYVLSEVPIQVTYQDNSILDHCVQEMYYSEQPVVVSDSNIEITGNSNIISYDQYIKENKSKDVQGTTSPAQQDAMMMSIIEEMSNQVAKCNAVNQDNNTVNESLTAELERYKKHIISFEERQKFDLNDREKYIDSQMRGIIFDRNAKLSISENKFTR
uniref:Integrase, catalytic region, zinc finger, CCHC-type, peptidase aspartic, catalytic n=1 Tax=Tanacetum cinerariifolium TaxID=118510 RepID=A0A6L2P5G1_TANCI|nr:integrase, catalytic region, zinc finger, CCHC-type, peptidase aspartic, catalytic [Tanacetum cinerariifolium]